MGIIQGLGYKVRKPNAAQVAMQHIASTRPGAWLFARTLHHIDKALLRLTKGQVTVPGVVAGLPVLTVTTTGARTGQRRSAPLLGVPVGEDIAVGPSLARLMIKRERLPGIGPGQFILVTTPMRAGSRTGKSMS